MKHYSTYYYFWNQKISPCRSGQYDNWICGLFHRLRGDSKSFFFSKAKKNVINSELLLLGKKSVFKMLSSMSIIHIRQTPRLRLLLKGFL